MLRWLIVIHSNTVVGDQTTYSREKCGCLCLWVGPQFIGGRLVGYGGYVYFAPLISKYCAFSHGKSNT